MFGATINATNNTTTNNINYQGVMSDVVPMTRRASSTFKNRFTSYTYIGHVGLGGGGWVNVQKTASPSSSPHPKPR